jgi:adenylate kinase family enzyme
MVSNSDEFMRTLVLGNGGSGKSWLSERLTEFLGVSAIELDNIHCLPGGFNARREPIEDIALKPYAEIPQV